MIDLDANYFRGDHELRFGFNWRRNGVRTDLVWPGSGTLSLHLPSYPDDATSSCSTTASSSLTASIPPTRRRPRAEQPLDGAHRLLLQRPPGSRDAAAFKDVPLAPDVGAHRLPAIRSFDVRVGKQFRVNDVTMNVDLDWFNILNASTVLKRQYDVGTAEGPTASGCGWGRMWPTRSPS